MSVDPLSPTGAPPSKGPYSPAVRAGDWIVFAGQVGLDSEGQLVAGGTVAEVERIFENLRAMFSDLGLAAADVARVAVFLTNIEDFAELNRSYGEFFGDHKPARTTIGVASLPAGAHVEIEVWAYRPV